MNTSTHDAFSPQIYGNYPDLDLILLHYLDIESVIQRHQVNPVAFETRESLYFLGQSFNLPTSLTFPGFLAGYDAKYPTVRSYSQPGAKPKPIILKAAEAGNLQAFYLGLRRNPKYKTPTFLDRALRRAARGDHQVMIDLIKDLGGTDDSELRGMAQGGHLEKLKHLISERSRLPERLVFDVTKDAVKFGQLAAVKYLTTLWIPTLEDWNDLIYSAGESGDQTMFDYVISQGGNDYTELILGAISRGHLELAMRYLEKPGLDHFNIFSQAIRCKCLDLAKFVARDHRIDQRVLNRLMENVKKGTTYETIDYLISLGGNNYQGLISHLAIYSQFELFKLYYLGPGVDYVQVLFRGLQNSSVEIVKFMLEQCLVPVTVDALNRYLRLVVFNPELIALLFSLGATDYRIIVERALINGDLALAVKYFDRAPRLRLNSIFKQCTKIPVYQYLLSQGRIKQKTVDATLAWLKQSDSYVKAENYLSSLNLQDRGSSSSSSSASD
jgi:hypothetical protein